MLVDSNILALEDCALVPSGFATGETAWRARLDPAQELDHPKRPYVHLEMQALEESANACVLCAMIWLRLQRAIYPETLGELQREGVIGIPVIRTGEVSYCGSFILGLVFSKFKGDQFVGREFHDFRAFNAISKSPGPFCLLPGHQQ